MAYADLNSIRASMCNTLEACDYTSIDERIVLSVNLKGIFKNTLFHDCGVTDFTFLDQQ
jgi:hypothetical protein